MRGCTGRPQLDSQVCVLVGELTQNDTTVGRWCGRPGRQLRCHVSIVAVVSVPCRPIADLGSEARQSQRISAPIRPTSPVNLGRRSLITLIQTFHCVFHLRVMSLARPLHRLVPDDRCNQDQGDRRCEGTVPGARTGATGLCPTQDQRQRCARWWAGVCGAWMSADSRSWPPSTRRRPSTWGPATAATCWPRPPHSPTGWSSASTPTRPG
jgi:hypothetical protein